MPINNEETTRLIEQFAKDFEIDFVSYKYNPETLIVTYTCADFSPSEVSLYHHSIPAFLIKTHYALIQSTVNKAVQEARISEVEWLRRSWREYMLPEDKELFDSRIAEIKALQNPHQKDKTDE